MPIIALTANALADDRQRCMDSGMDDYVSKPVSLDTLRRVLAKWLGRASPAAIGNDLVHPVLLTRQDADQLSALPRQRA